MSHRMSSVSSALASPAITSTRGMRWGGLTQCMPANRSGRYTAWAISVTDMPEVLVASTTSSPTIRLTSSQKVCLTSIFSGMASRTKSAWAKQSLDVVMVIRSSSARDSSCVRAPCSTWDFWLMEIR